MPAGGIFENRFYQLKLGGRGIISTIKRSEDDDSVVVRYFDMAGENANIELKFFRPIETAEKTNIIEEESVPIKLESKTLKLKATPYSIETVKFRLAD